MIELLITIVVLGVIVSIAFPSYQGSIRKGRRADAFSALTAIQQTQERWRGNNASYGSLSNLISVNSAISGNSTGNHYALSVVGVTASAYEARATAQGSQANDANCKVLAVKIAVGNITYGAGTDSASLNWSDPDRCWVK